MNGGWGALEIYQPKFIYLRKEGSAIEIFRNDVWNLLFKTEHEIGEVWYQGMSDGGSSPIYAKVVDYDDSLGLIYTEACTEDGTIIEPFTQSELQIYGPMSGIYSINYISDYMNMVNLFLPIDLIYCPVLNYSCFNGAPLIGNTCNSNFMVLSVDEHHNQSLTVFPNPSIGSFAVSGFEGKAKVKIYAMSGALINEIQIISHENLIDLKHYPAAFYNVIVETNQSVNSFRLLKSE